MAGGRAVWQAEEAAKALQPLTEFMKGVLGEKVEKVTVSQRLSDSPCALVTSKFGWSAYQERIMRSQVPNPPSSLLNTFPFPLISSLFFLLFFPKFSLFLSSAL